MVLGLGTPVTLASHNKLRLAKTSIFALRRARFKPASSCYCARHYRALPLHQTQGIAQTLRAPLNIPKKPNSRSLKAHSVPQTSANRSRD